MRCKRCWHIKKKDNVVVKWNLSYILCVQQKKKNKLQRRRRAKKINNFYVRQKHACLKARWMCQKKCAFLTLYLSLHHHHSSSSSWGEGEFFFSFFFSIIIYFYALEKERKFSHRRRRWWNFDDAGPWKKM